VVLLGGYLTLCVVWFSYLDRWTDPAVAVSVPVCVTLLLLGFLAYARRRSSSAGR
jgi:hypothetical protein